MKLFATFALSVITFFGAKKTDAAPIPFAVIDSENVLIDSSSGIATDDSTGKPVTALVVYRNPVSGKIESSDEYRNGQRDGFQRAYNKDGKEIFRGVWKLGKTDGLQTEFYPNGQKLREYYFSDGHMDGEYVEWYPGGGKKVFGLYRSSKKVGPWSHYDEKGQVDEMLNFQ